MVEASQIGYDLYRPRAQIEFLQIDTDSTCCRAEYTNHTRLC